MAWSKRQRFSAVLAGEPADRTPVSAWRHFIDREQTAEDLASALVEFQQKFDWDFVKINPRSTYQAETWGNQYDYGNYDGMSPTPKSHAVDDINDLERVIERPANYGPLGEQLTTVRLMRQALGNDIVLLQTLFSPLVILEALTGHKVPSGYRLAPRESNPVLQLIASDRQAVHRALRNIARTLSAYAAETLQAGGDGVFFATWGLARSGYLTAEEQGEFLEPYDRIVLEPLKSAYTAMHTCGFSAHPERFADYPVRILQWADRAPENPSVGESAPWIGNKVVLGGVNETLFGTGASEKIAAQATEAVKAMTGRPYLLAPGCSLPLAARDDELVALREAVR